MCLQITYTDVRGIKERTIKPVEDSVWSGFGCGPGLQVRGSATPHPHLPHHRKLYAVNIQSVYRWLEILNPSGS